MSKANRSIFFALFAATLSVEIFALPSTAQDSLPTATEIFTRSREAAGAKLWDAIRTIRAIGSEDSYAGVGQWQETDDVRNGWIRRASDFGLLRYSEIWGPQGRWRVDAGDGFHPINSRYANAATVTDEWMAQRGYLKESSAQIATSSVSVRNENGRFFRTVRVTPPNGQSVELWFDWSTFLLDRSVRVLPRYVETVVYSGYRSVKGVMLPFVITTSGSDDPADVDTVKVSEYQINPKTATDTFAKPTAPKDWSLSSRTVTVPMEFNGNVIVEAMLNGHGPFAFLWDTGGHDVLTTDVANALGLVGSGANTLGGSGAGTITVQFTKVKKVQIGGLTLTDQTFSVAPLEKWIVDRGQRPPLAGIMGPELCERLRVTLNYRDQTMTFRSFEAPPLPPKGTKVHIVFTDDMPLVPAEVESKEGDFGLDTGNSGDLIIFQNWAQKNGLAERLRAGKEGSSRGIGGRSKEWSGTVAHFTLGGATLRDVAERYSEDQTGSLSSTTEAGNFGSSILSHFIVEFDYSLSSIHLLTLDTVADKAKRREAK